MDHRLAPKWNIHLKEKLSKPNPFAEKIAKERKERKERKEKRKEKETK